MATLGILGSGRVATALATGLAAAGHRLVLGVRNPASAEAKWKGPAVAFAAPQQAAAGAEAVFNATPGEASVEALRPLAPALAGKLLVDVANATARGPDGLPSGLLYPSGSLAEALQAALPQTQVVKTLNTMLFSVMAAPRSLATPPTAFLSGDDPAAKLRTRELLQDLGWPQEWVLDLGGVATARGPEAFVLLVPSILKARGFKPFALSVAA